jgi:hypothetical protein
VAAFGKFALAPTQVEIDASDAVRSNSRGSTKRPTHGVFGMTKKSPTPKGTNKQAKVAHPGMMGDGTEEQNLGERGNPAARIRKKEVVAAFGKRRPTK